MSTLFETVKRYRTVQDRIAKLEEEKDKLRKELINLLGEEFEGKIKDYKVSIKQVQRTIINKEQLYKEVDISVLEKVSKAIQSTQVRVRKV